MTSLKENDDAVLLLARHTGGDLALMEVTEAGLLDPGHLALLGALLTEIGQEITDQARKDALGIMEGREAHDHGVRFESRGASVQQRVDSEAIKRLFSQEEYPQLFKEVRTKETVSIHLPKGEASPVPSS